LSITRIIHRNDKDGGAVQFRPAVFDIVLYIFAFLSPIAFLFPWNLDMFQRLFFSFGTLALFSVSFLCKKQVEYKNKMVGISLLWVLFVVLLHSSIFKSQYAVAGYMFFASLTEGFLYILCAFILFKLVVEYSTDKFSIKYPIIAINILNLIFAVMQKFGIFLIFTKVQSPCGLMGNKSQLALFSALSIPLLLNSYYKFHWVPWIFIPIITLFISSSFTAVLALFVASILYFYKENKTRYYAAIIAAAFFVIANFKPLLYKIYWVRFDVWLHTIKEIIKSPFVGYGFDNSLRMNKVFCTMDNGLTYRHNDYLNLARDLGLPALIILMVLLYGILKGTQRDYMWIAFMVVLIACFFQTSMYFPRIASTAIILAALIEKKKYGHDRVL